MSPPSFPPLVPCLGGAFLLRGVARGGFPRFSGSMHRYDSSPFLSLRISRPSARRYRPTLPIASAEKTRSPRFLGNPVVRLPCSQTPVGPPRLAFEDGRLAGSCCFRLPASCLIPLLGRCSRCLMARRCCPTALERRGPRTTISLSWLNHTAFALAVYASQLSSPRRDCTATQDSLPAAGQALPGGIGYPQGCFVRFRSAGLHNVLLTQACPGATQMECAPRAGRCSSGPRVLQTLRQLCRRVKAA